MVPLARSTLALVLACRWSSSTAAPIPASRFHRRATMLLTRAQNTSLVNLFPRCARRRLARQEVGAVLDHVETRGHHRQPVHLNHPAALRQAMWDARAAVILFGALHVWHERTYLARRRRPGPSRRQGATPRQTSYPVVAHPKCSKNTTY